MIIASVRQEQIGSTVRDQAAYAHGSEEIVYFPAAYILRTATHAEWDAAHPDAPPLPPEFCYFYEVSVD